MNKPKKCKNCEYYGKPYWSIINPCDNCPYEENDIVTITRWEDPTIDELRKENERLNNIINELERWLKEHSIIDYNCSDVILHEQIALNIAFEYLQELKENKQ